MRSPGYIAAQAGGVLMVVGGGIDLGIRQLLPHHVSLLEGASGTVSPEAAGLVLALLRALGGALVAAGVAVLVLLHLGRKSGDRLPFVAAGVVAVLAEGPNAWGILRTGSSLYLAPLTFMLLVVAGSSVCVLRASRKHTE